MKSKRLFTLAFIGAITHYFQFPLVSNSAFAQVKREEILDEVYQTDYPFESEIKKESIQNFSPKQGDNSWRPIQSNAKKSTTLIQSKKDPTLTGSGFIVSKKDNTYVVLTSAHIFDGNDQYTVTTSTNASYPVTRIQKFPNLDLTRFQFQSDESYEVAPLGNFRDVQELDAIQVSGFPNPEAKRNPALVSNSGKVTAITDKPGLDGYSIIYNAQTHRGMSGGPVLNQYGHVIAIHGRQESNPDGTVPYDGIKLGIPISLYSQALKNPEHQNLSMSPFYADFDHNWIRLHTTTQAELERQAKAEKEIQEAAEAREKEEAEEKEKEEEAKLKAAQDLELKQTINAAKSSEFKPINEEAVTRWKKRKEAVDAKLKAAQDLENKQRIKEIVTRQKKREKAASIARQKASKKERQKSPAKPKAKPPKATQQKKSPAKPKAKPPKATQQKKSPAKPKAKPPKATQQKKSPAKPKAKPPKATQQKKSPAKPKAKPPKATQQKKSPAKPKAKPPKATQQKKSPAKPKAKPPKATQQKKSPAKPKAKPPKATQQKKSPVKPKAKPPKATQQKKSPAKPKAKPPKATQQKKSPAKPKAKPPKATQQKKSPAKPKAKPPKAAKQKK